MQIGNTLESKEIRVGPKSALSRNTHSIGEFLLEVVVDVAEAS